jgi:DNA-binding SARP family transcriptional activator/tetratricopeptide (TPR) repeat protein
VDFQLLGPFEVWHDGSRVDVGAGHQLRVLVTLLLNANRPVTSERLCEVLWPNPADRKPKSVITYVSRLNGRFKAAGAGEVTITNEPSGYVLRLDRKHIDLVRFERLRDEARQALAEDDDQLARGLLHDALDLYRGEFLADLEIDHVEARTRKTLAEAHLDTLADVAELELAAGNHRWVRDRLPDVVRENPMRQRLAAAVMEAYLLDGEPERAVAVYDQTNEALHAQRGMRTSAKLKDLLWLAQYGTARTSLPPRPVGFVGRRDQIDAILTAAGRAAAGSNAELVWISGMPGVGKTALAVHAAYEVANRFSDGTLYIDLHGYTPNVVSIQPAEALDQLLRLLGVPAGNIPPTIEGRMARYRAWLDGTRTVVILDNVETERQVEQLLPVAPGCLAIVTSRHVGGPRAGTRLHLDPLPDAEAVQLLCNVAGRQRVSSDWTLAGEIVRRCGCVPLQVKVVATQFLEHPSWPLGHLAVLLREHSPLHLDSGSADQTGEAACAVSYQHLTQEQQRLFRLVGRSPCPDLEAHAAAALARTSLPGARALMADLHRVSLLTEITPERYRMPDLLRAYAASLPVEPGSDVRQELRPLLDHYLTVTAAAVAVAFPHDRDRQPAVAAADSASRQFSSYGDALGWLSTEYANLVAIVRYAAAQGERDYCWRLAVLLWRFFYTTGRLKDWSETLELAKGLLETEPTDPHGIAQVLLRLSGARWFTGELETAVELAGRALSWSTRLGDVLGEAEALCALAFPEIGLGCYPQAREHLEQALDRYERLGDLRGKASALDNLGVLEERAGELVPAERHHEQAYALLKQLGHRFGQAYSLDNLGGVRQKLGRLEEAMANHREALALAEEIGARSVQSQTLNSIGNALRRSGRLDEALESHRKALRIAEAIGNINACADVHNDLGETRRARGEHREALASHGVARELAEGIGDRRQAARAELGMARARHALGRHQQALANWQAAIDRYRTLNLPEADAVVRERDLLDCACHASR